MWIFGYGSLVWKVDFPVEERIVGYIKGYKRRFWQASVDHRGVPDKPGRVVTLVKSDDPECLVWGCAYKIHKSLVEEGGKLHQREQRYTQRLLLNVFTDEGKILSEPALVFVGTDDPTLQLGSAPLCDMAIQIAGAKGPSGPNSEYLFKLAYFLREETSATIEEESELFELEEADCVYGVAYKVSSENERKVLIHLDYREKGGYLRSKVIFHPKEPEIKSWELTIYVGTNDNQFYTGPTEENVIASIISESVGPSGTNKEYLFELYAAMNVIGGLDDHLIKLREKVLLFEATAVNKMLTN